MAATSSTQVFLEIAVGNVAAHRRAVIQWKRFQKFVKERGESFGCPSDAEELDETQRETMKEVFEGENGVPENGVNEPLDEKTNKPTVLAVDSDGPDNAILTIKPKEIIVGKLIFDLYTKDCPKTSENFRSLCTGEKGIGKGHNKEMWYKNTTFHRYCEGLFLHGGDFTRYDGSGGDSIYGGKFNDEKRGLEFKDKSGLFRHDSMGILSMANSGKNSNTSQFFITLGACPKLDGKHVIFGRLASESSSVLLEIVKRAAGPETGFGKAEKDKEITMETVTIVDCGEVKK